MAHGGFGFAKKLKVPSIADSITEVTLIKYLKNVGDFVEKDENFIQVESHKGTAELKASDSGVITKLLLTPGADVKIDADAAEIDENAKAGPKSQAPKEAAKEESASKKKGDAESDEAKSKKKAEPEAEEAKPKREIKKSKEPVADHKTSITSDTKSQTKAEPEKGKPAEAKSAPAPTRPASPPKPKGDRSETREKMSRTRKTVGERLKHSQNTYATVVTFQEVDMSRIMEMRKEMGEEFQKKHGVKLGIMSFFIKAVAKALTERPIVNAVIDDASKEIVYRNYVDISVAVSAPKGLLVPVVRDCQDLSFAEVEQQLADFGAQAKNNTLAIEDMMGGTFTISNGGVFGSMMSVPIINPPQSAILGMHNIVQRPVVRDGEIVARPIMYITMSYDHRLLDGREGAGFLHRVAQLLDDPRRLLLDS